jgi:two-component system sensor histidine kinase/response regulator
MNTEIQPCETLEEKITYLEEKIYLLERENKSLKQREFSVLKSLPEIVFMINTDESFSFLNNTCFERFQISEFELKQKVYIKEIITPESLFYLRKLYVANNHADTIHAEELTGIQKDGGHFQFTAYFSKIYNNNKLIGFIGIGFDIADRKNIENRLREANLAKSKFLSIIAHDLRNPFNSLVGFSSLLLTNYDRYSSTKIKSYIQHMSTAATQGCQLLENLLEWARANTGKIDFNPLTINLNQTAYDAYELLIASATKKEISIKMNIPDTIHVFADSNMVLTIFRNLISNAIKFTPRNGEVVVFAYENTEYAFIEVVDNGIGIAADKLANIFSLNNDYSSVGTEKEHGTGLGLILCNEFIVMNKGKIEVESKVGEGSTFRISLPRYNSKKSCNL